MCLLPVAHPTARPRVASSCSPWSWRRSCSVAGRAATLLGLVLMQLLLLQLTPEMPSQAAATPVRHHRSSSSSTWHQGRTLLLSYETQCVSSTPDPSSTTTTDPTTGYPPLPCDLLGAQAAQDHTFLAIFGLALVGFLLCFLVGLRLWV